MNRISPEMVLEAYKKTGLKPMQGDLFPRDGCACALGSFAAMNGYKDTANALLFLNNLTSHDYVNAFGEGFDGERFHSYGDKFDNAFRDGQEAWEAVKHLSDLDS